MLDPFNSDKGKSAPAKKSWEEALIQKPKGGGIGSKKKSGSGASGNTAEETETGSENLEIAKEPQQPPKPVAVLSNPQWQSATAFFDETMGASVEGTLPAEISHLTRVTFTPVSRSHSSR